SSIEPGMEIQLDTSSSLTDISGNGPGPCDPSLVPIGVRYRPVPPEAGVFYDTDADGRIDSVMVSFVKNLHDPHNSITPYVILESGDSIRIDSFRVNSEDTTSVIFDLRDAVSDSIEINTGRDMDLVMKYPGFANEYERVIRDSAAPVITSAEYFPGRMVSDTGNAPDTLELRFSESISLSSVQDSPFVIMNPDGREFRFAYSERPQVSEDRAVFITEEPSGFPVDGSVIWINPYSGVSDRYSTQQNNPSNLRTPMVVHPRPYSLTIHVQTPVDPKTNNPVADINNAGIELNRPLSFPSGVMIEVRPLQPLNSIRLEGIEIQIFDVVGNRLINYEGTGQGEHIEFSRDQETGRLFIIWDGRNTSGRYVAKGTYLLRLRIKDSNGEYYGLSDNPEAGNEPWRFIKID
ncbi:MAG: hypothetical protein ACOCSE_04615, partial [Chitinivibrionales bacterium]